MLSRSKRFLVACDLSTHATFKKHAFLTRTLLYSKENVGKKRQRISRTTHPPRVNTPSNSPGTPRASTRFDSNHWHVLKEAIAESIQSGVFDDVQLRVHPPGPNGHRTLFCNKYVLGTWCHNLGAFFRQAGGSVELISYSSQPRRG